MKFRDGVRQPRARVERFTEAGGRAESVLALLWPGKSEQLKKQLAEAITDDMMKVLHYEDESVSVMMEEVSPQDWTKKVYKPDIAGKWDKLY